MLTSNSALNADTAADNHGVHGGRFVHGGIRRDLQAVAGPDLSAVDAQGRPAIQLTAGQLVGHPQGFYGGSQGNEREIVQQQEADGLRRTVLGLSPGLERRHRDISSHKAGDGLRRRLLLWPSISRGEGLCNDRAIAMPKVEWVFNNS